MFLAKCDRCGVLLDACRCSTGGDGEIKPDPNVGSKLAELIPGWFKTKACGCEEYAEKMDRWGVDGCEERFDEIVEYLVAKAKLFMVPEIVARSQAKKWLRAAIDDCRDPAPKPLRQPRPAIGLAT